MIERRILANLDWGLIISMMLVPLMGLVVLYSAGFDPYSTKPVYSWLPSFVRSQPFVKQSIFLLIGICVMAIAAMIPTSILFRYGFILYAIGLALLVAVALFGVVANGSRRWLSFGGFNLQPAEFMKLAVIVSMARYLSRNPPKTGVYGLKQILIPSLIFLAPMALIMKQPDLGTALAVGAAGSMMMLFVGIHWKSLVVLFVTAAIAVIPAWRHLHPYQQNRVLSLFNPDFDPKGTGYHINQSKIAVGSGELFGKGFLGGTQTQLEFLPEHTTDFIFSVLAEEWGFVGCIVVLCAYFLFLYRLLRVALKTKDLFSSLLVVGISSLIFFHASINIGMVVGILPVVGIPLPLFSYGGSSVLSTLFGVGLVLGVSVRRGYSAR